MNIKRVINWFSVVLLFLVTNLSCHRAESVRIAVQVTSPGKSMLYLSEKGFQKSKLIDSVRIAQGTSIKRFRLRQGQEPTFYTLTVKNGGTITLLAAQGENIDISFDTQKLLNYTVAGSEGSKKVQQLSVEFARAKQRMDELKSEFEQAGDVAIKSSIQNEMQEVFDRQKEFSSKFIWDNPMSKASVIAIYQKFDDNMYVFGTSDDMLLIKTVATAMNALYPKSDFALGMLNDVKNLERLVAKAKINQLVAQDEGGLPELEINDINGKPVKLSDLKGKVVLLDFWVTQNINSLMENRELLNIYNRFKNSGFEIYQVALDSDRPTWAKALEAHKLPWVSVCEGQKTSHAASIYNVQEIPSNYLIDRQQRIVGKNLYGQKLVDKLKSLL